MINKFEMSFPCLGAGDGEPFRKYEVRATPFAFLIGEHGRVLSKDVCSTPGRLRRLFERAEVGVVLPQAPASGAGKIMSNGTSA